MKQNQNFSFHKSEIQSQIATQNIKYKTHTGTVIIIRHSLKYKIEVSLSKKKKKRITPIKTQPSTYN